MNKGIKADYKQYWDVELGVTYIPWDKVKPEELEGFCEGGMLDNDTLNPGKTLLPFLLQLIYLLSVMHVTNQMSYLFFALRKSLHFKIMEKIE